MTNPMKDLGKDYTLYEQDMGLNKDYAEKNFGQVAQDELLLSIRRGLDDAAKGRVRER